MRRCHAVEKSFAVYMVRPVWYGQMPMKDPAGLLTSRASIQR